VVIIKKIYKGEKFINLAKECVLDVLRYNWLAGGEEENLQIMTDEEII
jgi:hypothetical protein